jgi:hypothetical protein
MSHLFDGYLSDKEAAAERDVTRRCLSYERQRGKGPPYVKIGQRIYYPIEGFRAWLKSLERQPVRAGSRSAARSSTQATA